MNRELHNPSLSQKRYEDIEQWFDEHPEVDLEAPLEIDLDEFVPDWFVEKRWREQMQVADIPDTMADAKLLGLVAEKKLEGLAYPDVSGLSLSDRVKEAQRFDQERRQLLDETDDRPCTNQELLDMGFTQQKIDKYKEFYEGRVDIPITAEGKRLLEVAESKEKTKLSEVFAYYETLKSVAKSDIAFRQALEFFDDPYIEDIKRLNVLSWIDHMKGKGNSRGTIQKRLSTVKAAWNMFRRYHERKDLDHELFSHHDLPDDISSDQKVLPLHKDHVAELSRFCLGKIGSKRQTQHNRDLICLLLYTGARPSEIGRLEKEDIVLDVSVPFIWIRENQKGKKKNVKTQRMIPLLSEAMEAAKRLQKTGIDKSLVSSDSMNARTTNIFEGLGIQYERVSPNSIRHTWPDALREAGVLDSIRIRITGHSISKSSESYGSNMSNLRTLKEAMEKALPYLGSDNEALYVPKSSAAQTPKPIKAKAKKSKAKS